MELLNPAFVILCIKIAICVVPAAVGIYLITMSEEKKRELRNSFCKSLMGVPNAIPYTSFERALIVIGVLGLLFGVVAAWFLIIAGMLQA